MILANSADPDEMQHDAAFYLGLHCLQKYPFRGFKFIKGKWKMTTSNKMWTFLSPDEVGGI